MIFIFGIERSATTWVANILDHHPGTDVYMEPLSGFNTRFRDWPGSRFTELKNLPDEARYFEKEFATLKQHRRFLLTNYSNSAAAWRFDLRWAGFLVRKKMASDKATDFLELNFHRKNRRMPVHKQPPMHTIIKEMRLNFNAGLVTELNTHPRGLVVIREMASCVRSILDQLEKGNLVDLQNDLMSHYGAVNAQTVCRYWHESYSTLINTLQNRKVSYTIVSHTNLLKQPMEAMAAICSYLDLSVAPGVRRYLNASNQQGSGKHSTQRDRRTVLDQISRDQKQVYPEVPHELEQVRNHPVLKKFAREA